MDQWALRFFESSTELLAVLHPDGRILQANAAWRGAVGWPPEALKAGGCRSFVHPEDLEAMDAQLRGLGGREGRADLYCRWRCQDGSWVRLSWRVVSSGEEGLLFCTVKPPEPPELTPEAGSWSMSDSLPFGLYLLEARSDRILYANHRFCQMAGIEEVEALIRQGSLSHSQLIQHHLSAQNAKAFFQAVANQGTPPPIGLQEREVMLASGRLLRRLSTPMTTADGKMSSVLYLFEDVTERRRTENALLSSEQNFHKLIEGMPDGVFVHRNRRFIYVNNSLRMALGYEHVRELIGKPIWSIVHPDDLGVVRERVHTVADMREIAPLEEIRYLRRDGSWYDAESTGVPVEFDGEEAVVVIARDITERKRMQAQLLQTDRMALVGTLAAGVGHEINNPLSYVLANLNLALEALRLPTQECECSLEAAGTPGYAANLREMEELLQEAQEGATRVRNIVRDLKSFSRQDAERRTEVDVQESLDFSIKMASVELRHRAHLIRKYEPVPSVYADTSRLGQVFLNLLMNAAQAIPEGSTTGNHITVWVRPGPPGQVAVDVSDTGAGISPEVQDRIFDPFFTTKPVGIGTGLGLSICHGIIRSLGGEIFVRSELGKGTTFTVLLPAASPSWKPVPLASAVPARRAGSSGRILVIDDEPAVGRSLARLIGSPHQVTVVESGRDGMAKLSSSEPFDVVVCDLMMPDVTGMDVYERVCEARPELAGRFIFITGGSFTPRARQFLESVPEQWLEKPFDEQQLHLFIEKALNSH
ncbi:PAS domain S-box protein [Stigmatella sp. ncwal1]|uniref:histidine kinase n=1 Tax=Stigmatella ashevillensis TaxID=2995309 RepID=A0ABT5DN66_9BACT|nr:PAS domain S-box protein [Stigmatella ashevillena]MDC0714590.1 PAS domain S-box protein [Stigmatella ashevillena]